MPGTDHAAIATEVKVVDALKKEGLTKKDIGREEFLERAWEWKRRIRRPHRAPAAAIWAFPAIGSTSAFTMDEGLSRAVRETFVNLYEKGLIYRGDRIINWCPVLPDRAFGRGGRIRRAAVAPLAHPLSRSRMAHDVVVATTRPETMLGDTGVCVNPNDPSATPISWAKRSRCRS